MRSIRYGTLAVLMAVAGGGTPLLAQGTPGLFGGSTVGGNGGLGNYSGSSGGGEGLQDAGGLPGQDQRLNYASVILGNPAKQGPFVFTDIVSYTQTYTLGNQLVARRGLRDSSGVVTGTPGTIIGSGETALSTDTFGRNGYSPGVNLGVGWKFDDGSSLHARIMHISGQTFSASASGVAPYQRASADLSDTFLFSDVFNFSPAFGGPARKTAFEGTFIGQKVDAAGNILVLGTLVPDRAFYGLWNGASNMSIEYKRWYTEVEIGGRTPLFESDMSKVYAIGGMRHHAFMDRFSWLTNDYDLNGNTGGAFEAKYENILSQRLFGPYIGCVHDWYLKNNFSLSTELSGGLMANFIKERASYTLDDNSTSAKRTVRSIDLVPTAGGNVNLWWYPVRGVQLRAGYTVNTFYNTLAMQDPIGFNFGAIDPTYKTQYFRIIHGFNIGFGVFF